MQSTLLGGGGFPRFEHGVSACVLKSQALFEVWHCDSLKAVLAGIFGFYRLGPLVALSTTLEPAWVSDALHADVAALRSACPFLNYAQGLPDFPPGPWGLDAAEQSLHSAVSMADLIQWKRDTPLAGGAAILPAGLPAALHATCAAALPSAVLTDPVLPLDLKFVVALSAGCLDVPLKKLRRWRSTQLREFKRTIGALAADIQPLFDSVAGVGAQLLWQDFSTCSCCCGGCGYRVARP